MTIFINENGIKKQLTAEEEIAFNKEIEKAKIAKENNKIAEADKETKKTSGKQKLLDLGLSEEEVKALIGV
jgi:ABC-type transport system involved in cytochrome c biogenesis ATPase subunit